MMTDAQYAAHLREVAKDIEEVGIAGAITRWQFDDGDGKWENCGALPVANVSYLTYRRKPSTTTRTVTLELPVAMKEPPKVGDQYWTIVLHEDGFASNPVRWDGGGFDVEVFNSGHAWRTESEASAVASALNAAFRGGQ